jgi:hypothetical protein
MTASSNDLTIDELLRDPVTRALMRADHVDPSALAAMLRSVVPVIEKGTPPPFWESARGQGDLSRCDTVRRSIHAQLCGAL